MKLKLKFPIEIGKTTIDTLTFRDYATAADLLAFDQVGANRQTIVLIANLTGQDDSIIERLHLLDYRAADDLATKLLLPEAEQKNDSES